LKHSKQSLTDEELIELESLVREEEIDGAKTSFWNFCRVISPDFYKPDREYLHELCDTLQGIYERSIIAQNGKPYTKIRVELPPRHGKSRTMTNFSAWVLGVKNTEKIITASYNDDLAQDFSRHTRDIIMEEKNLAEQITYSDIFTAKVKQGDASYKKWALEGQFFNYKGTGIGGSITGRGGSILIIDDPVKDAETAYNEAALEKIWLWYTGTYLSRAEEGAIQILCMTPWSKKDIGAKLEEAEPGEWLVLSMPACTSGKMLCPEILSRESYESKKRIADENIFSANYDLVRLDVKGRLYSGFKTYTEIPQGTTSNACYVDTADEGDDYLCAIMGRKKGLDLYVTGVYYTQEGQEVTEGELVTKLMETATMEVEIESNNGGRAFARNVQRIASERGYRASIRWFHQGANKQARILTNAAIAQQFVHFPVEWAVLWPDFYNALMTYQKEGKNKHDDAPDALTGLVEKFGSKTNMAAAPTVALRL
jgi:predicted phage terminase large subunit-like protein